MKLHILLVAGIVLVVVAGSWDVSKHYHISKIAESTGTPKTVVEEATKK